MLEVSSKNILVVEEEQPDNKYKGGEHVFVL
jgi:hypothetical protein